MSDSNHTREALTSSTEPAVLGSYGLPPEGFRLPEATGLGPVVLQVSSIERSLDFYGSILGMRLLDRRVDRAKLGSLDGTHLVELREHKGARPRPHGRTGLFHFAILLPDRGSLGRFARHLAGMGINPGASDHLVSEAFYLQDPDNLGIEVYADRPRSAWLRQGRELKMTTEPLDLQRLISAAHDEPWQGMPPGTTMGHVHLQVGDLGDAADFYADALGFDRMVWQYPGALFLGAGGYHHHLGTNVWGGRGAAPARSDEAQLLEWTLELPKTGDLGGVIQSLEAAGYETVKEEDLNATVRDPWGTVVRLRTGSKVLP